MRMHVDAGFKATGVSYSLMRNPALLPIWQVPYPPAIIANERS